MKAAYLAPLALMISAGAAAAEIRIVPGDTIIANRANSRGYTDFIVHAIAVRADKGETLDLDSLRIDLMAGGSAVLSETLTGKQLVGETADLVSAPVQGYVAGQLLDRAGFNGLFGAASEPAKAARLSEGQVLATTRRYYTTRQAVDGVRVTVKGRNANGLAFTGERLVPVVPHPGAIQYRAPVKGIWLMQGMPTLQGHHRFNPPTEYAMDFFKVDAEGRLAKGDPLVAENSYGYGADVLAAADGVVASVTDGETQDRAAMTRRPDESPQAAGERIGQHNMQRLRRDFERATAGNLVVLRHEQGGAVEYTSYAHLRRGIPVKVGQRVAQGQVIGHVGDTGDSPAVHLHFQVNAASDPFASKSLPAAFAGLKNAAGNSELGRFVVAE